MKPSFTHAAQTRERGSILPLVAAGMTAILGVTALSLDVGNVLVARGQLKNAADAAAVVGASSLANPGTNNATLPNLTLAETNAKAALVNLKNQSNGVDAVQATLIKAGGWDFSNPQFGLQAWNDNGSMVPAVQVVLEKSAERNQVVGSLFASVLGIPSFSPSVTVVAIGDYGPATAKANQIFPMAIPQCVFDQYWDSEKQLPKLDNGNPISIRVYSTYGVTGNNKAASGCQAQGIWTPLTSDSVNSGKVIFDLISAANSSSTGSPTGSPTVNVGDGVVFFEDNGAKASIYGKIKTKLGAFVPVVSGTVSGGTSAKVVAFACVIITDSRGGSDKYVEFQLLPVSARKVYGLINSGADGFSCQLDSLGVSQKTYITSPPMIVN